MLRRFDYRCTVCSHTEEVWVKGNPPTTTCTKCGEIAEKLISQTSIKFGSGFPGADLKWARDHEKAARK